MPQSWSWLRESQEYLKWYLKESKKENKGNLMQGHGCDGKVSAVVCGFNRKSSPV